jgi:hypothetical protein
MPVKAKAAVNQAITAAKVKTAVKAKAVVPPTDPNTNHMPHPTARLETRPHISGIPPRKPESRLIRDEPCLQDVAFLPGVRSSTFEFAL